MILKKNFNPVRVLQYIRMELFLSVVTALLVCTLHYGGFQLLSLPFAVSAILGSALAIFIAFRNNSAYARWWEARTLWAGIQSASRVLGRLIVTFTDSHAHKTVYERQRSEQFKKEMTYACIAWVHALRLTLRNEPQWNLLQPFLSEEDFAAVLEKPNKPLHLHLLMGQKIYMAMGNGTLAGFDSFQMEGQLLTLANHQAGCEKIKSTPLLRQYHYFTRVFLQVFVLLLPFSLYPEFLRLDLVWVLLPVSVVISSVFAILGKVGEVNEDPFENRITDVPLTTICDRIEIDLRQILGEPVAFAERDRNPEFEF